MKNILQSKILVVSFWWRSIYNLVIQKLQSEMCNEFILVKTKNNCCVFRFFTFWIQTVCLCEKERAAPCSALGMSLCRFLRLKVILRKNRLSFLRLNGISASLYAGFLEKIFNKYALFISKSSFFKINRHLWEYILW
jgi:hypothetical protein